MNTPDWPMQNPRVIIVGRGERILPMSEPRTSSLVRRALEAVGQVCGDHLTYFHNQGGENDEWGRDNTNMSFL